MLIIMVATNQLLTVCDTSFQYLKWEVEKTVEENMNNAIQNRGLEWTHILQFYMHLPHALTILIKPDENTYFHC
jgi:hypothetical protein